MPPMRQNSSIAITLAAPPAANRTAASSRARPVTPGTMASATPGIAANIGYCFWAISVPGKLKTTIVVFPKSAVFRNFYDATVESGVAV